MKAAGVAHFTFVGVPPHLKPNAPLLRYKRIAEAAVRTSGMRWTVLQPSVGNGALGWISVGDVAEHCLRSLDDPRMHNRDVPLAGPAVVSHNDVVKEFERVTGRSFAVKRVPLQRQIGLPLTSISDYAERVATRS